MANFSLGSVQCTPTRPPTAPLSRQRLPSKVLVVMIILFHTCAIPHNKLGNRHRPDSLQVRKEYRRLLQLPVLLYALCRGGPLSHLGEPRSVPQFSSFVHIAFDSLSKMRPALVTRTFRRCFSGTAATSAKPLPFEKPVRTAFGPARADQMFCIFCRNCTLTALRMLILASVFLISSTNPLGADFSKRNSRQSPCRPTNLREVSIAPRFLSVHVTKLRGSGVSRFSPALTFLYSYRACRLEYYGNLIVIAAGLSVMGRVGYYVMYGKEGGAGALPKRDRPRD